VILLESFEKKATIYKKNVYYFTDLVDSGRQFYREK